MRLIRCAATVAILAAGASIVPASGTGHAQEPSVGCRTFNILGGGNLPTLGFGPSPFRAGETVSAFVSNPNPDLPTPNVVTMTVNDQIVDRRPCAAAGTTVRHTFPAALKALVRVSVDQGHVSFGFDCTDVPACTMTGTAGRDVLVGTEGADVICGLGNRDVIDGRGGNDVVLGGAGGDSIRGGGGQDMLFGESGADSIDSGDGASGDVVSGGTGRDALSGDPGDGLTQ